MNKLSKLAILGFVFFTAPLPAQNVPEPALGGTNIIGPEHPTRDDRQHIGLSHNRADNAPSLKVAPAGMKVSKLANGETLQLPTDAVELSPDCPDSTNFPLVVTPDGRCRILATLKDTGGAGQYTAKVRLVGKGGGQEEVTLLFARRGSIWCAIGLVVLGLVIGLIVLAWRGGGRDRARTAIAIKEAIEALERLDESAAPRPPRMSQIIARALEIQSAALKAQPFDAAEVVEIQRRVAEYRFLRAIEAQASDLSPDRQAELAVTIDAALEAMNPTPGGPLAAVPPAILVAVRDKLKELKARPVSGLAADTEQPIPGELIPLPITLRMSPAQARVAFAIAEYGVALILALVFAATALGTLYYGKTYWGSYGDMLAAFLVGFGACAGGIASVDAFLQRARNVPTFP